MGHWAAVCRGKRYQNREQSFLSVPPPPSPREYRNVIRRPQPHRAIHEVLATAVSDEEQLMFDSVRICSNTTTGVRKEAFVESPCYPPQAATVCTPRLIQVQMVTYYPYAAIKCCRQDYRCRRRTYGFQPTMTTRYLTMAL
ncbi:hypothetical protein GWK47_040117 [Chionoecetes opilio]|uniref:Uncharacterized protein n=1 Tax=Chionoecetes opilio TaxID=41210 RepID=A0A8J4YCA6_CHIOP|nr:hypothetical protein GWK47_040117 [Chionoecetes opilio]